MNTKRSLPVLFILFGNFFAGATTYTQDVAIILLEKCVDCHQIGEIAPMSLTTYDEVRPWVKSIRREISSRRMPPFHAEGPIGKWTEDPRLTDHELDKVLEWIDSGAPRGPRFPYAHVPKGSSREGWGLGEPQKIIEFEYVPQKAHASGKRDDFVYLTSDYQFEETVYVRAIEWKIGNPKVIHHANATVVNRVQVQEIAANGEAAPENRSAGGIPQDSVQVIDGWLPGRKPHVFPNDQVIMIKAGSSISIDIHAIGDSDTKESRVLLGLYYAENDARISRRIQQVLGHQEIGLNIAPFESNYRRKHSERMAYDALVTHFRVHMHYRGKSAKIVFDYPGWRRQETVLNIPRFDANWQRHYYLASPIQVPAGTVVEFTATWDNSEKNPLNPNPRQRVGFGPHSTDEMGAFVVFYSRLYDD